MKKPKTVKPLGWLRGLVFAASLLIAMPTLAAKPAPFTGVVVGVSDGDTYNVKRPDGEIVRVRLHYADAPEVAHNRREVDQPHGRDAKAFAERRLLGKSADVRPAGVSYDRIVADVRTAEGDDMAKELEQHGWAMLDRRFKPPASLVEAENQAKQAKRGVWADDTPTPPWEWRKQYRAGRLGLKLTNPMKQL